MTQLKILVRNEVIWGFVESQCRIVILSDFSNDNLKFLLTIKIQLRSLLNGHVIIETIFQSIVLNSIVNLLL